MKLNKNILTILIILIYTGCAPRQVVHSMDDVEKQRVEYLDGKLRSLEVLSEIYLDKNQPYDVRVSALGVLSESRHPIALETIHKSVESSSLVELDLMLQAIDFLTKYGNESSAAFLVSGLKASEDRIMEIRESMINAISILGSEDDVITLLDLYEVSKTNHARMNELLTLTLGAMGDRRVIPILIEIVNNDELDVRVRNRAVEVLSRKKAPEVVDFFVELLGDPKSNLEMKDFALNTLGDVKEERMIMALLESYQSGKKDYYYLLNTLIQAMGEFDHPAVKRPLVEIALSEDFSRDLRIKSLQSLARFKDPTVLDEIISILEEPENYMFYNEIIDLVHEYGSYEDYKGKLRSAAFKAHQNYTNGSSAQ